MKMLVDASAAFNQGGGIGGSARHIVVRAPAVVYPPRYEAVGLPMLEALAVGVPVVASSAPVPREVAADTAVYADPGDAAALATPVEVALTSDQRPATGGGAGWAATASEAVRLGDGWSGAGRGAGQRHDGPGPA